MCPSVLCSIEGEICTFKLRLDVWFFSFCARISRICTTYCCCWEMHARFWSLCTHKPCTAQQHKNVCLLVSCCHQVQRKHRPCVCITTPWCTSLHAPPPLAIFLLFFPTQLFFQTLAPHIRNDVCAALWRWSQQQCCCMWEPFFVCVFHFFSSVSDVCTKLFRHFVLLLSSVCPPMIIVRICGRGW